MKIKNKYLCIMLTLLLCVNILSVPDFSMISQAADDTIEISTAEDFFTFAEKSLTYDYAGRTVELTCDINLGNTASNPTAYIGQNGKNFNGTFNGNFHTISGIYIIADTSNTTESYSSGLFSYLGESGTIKNLSVEGTLKAYTNGGGLVGNSFGAIINCSSNIQITGSTNLGGIVGNMRCGTVANCFSLGDITASSGSIGGIVGNMQDYNGKSGIVSNCYNLGQISTSDTAKVTIGELIGRIGSGNYQASNLYYNSYLAKLSCGIGYSAIADISEDSSVTALTKTEMLSQGFVTLLNTNKSSLPALGHSYADWAKTENYPAFSGSFNGFDSLIDPHPFSVTYSGGTSATGTPPTDKDMIQGTTFRLPANTFQKTDYTFLGWSDGKSIYKPGETYVMPASNVTFTAVWKLSYLPAVEGLTIVKSSANYVNLTWKAHSTAKSYYVYRASSTDPEYQKIASVNFTSFTDTSVKEGSTYFYKVSAIFEDTESGLGSFVSSTTVLPAVTKAKVTSPKKNTIKISFKKVSGAKKYYIYYSTKKKTGYKKLAVITTNKKVIKSNKLKSKKTYYIKIVPYRKTLGTAVIKKVKIKK